MRLVVCDTATYLSAVYNVATCIRYKVPGHECTRIKREVHERVLIRFFKARHPGKQERKKGKRAQQNFHLNNSDYETDVPIPAS